MQKLKTKNKKIKNKVKKNIIYTKIVNMFRVEAFSKLNMIIYYYYLVYLNKKNKRTFVQDRFSELLFTNFLYIKIKKNIVKSFK